MKVVPPAYDSAALTVVQADTGDLFGPIQNVSDGVTILSDRSTVTLTLAITERTEHPLTSIAIDFRINGEGSWKSIKRFTAAELAARNLNVGSQLTVSWDRTRDFADLLDMRGQATVRVTVSNRLNLSRPSTATLEIIPPALQLGGLSIDAGYLNDELTALPSVAGLATTDGTLDILESSLETLTGETLISASLLPLALILFGLLDEVGITLPAGFEIGDPQIHPENFGNAITPRPTWYPLAAADQRDPGRWVNGNQLHLYTVAGPTAESLTFNLTGAGTATAAAEKVEAGASFTYTFQLEEELVAIFAGSMPAFASVNLMIDDRETPIGMTPGDAGLWSAEAELTPGSTVSYYYVIELAQPYNDPLIGKPITAFPLPDLRNLQIEMDEALTSIIALLMGGVDQLATLDPGLRSLFTVPPIDHDSQSLWVGKLDLMSVPDGMYQLEAAVQYSGGSTDAIAGKMFTLDRTAPRAETMVHPDNPGENISLYKRADGVYIATPHLNSGEVTLNISAIPIGDSDLEVYMYQVAALDDEGNPKTWNPILTPGLVPSETFRVYTNPGDILPLTYKPPHQVQMVIRNDAGDQFKLNRSYAIRTVGIDSILNADSTGAPVVKLDLLSPEADSAMISLVEADYDGNDMADGPYESQPTDGEVTVFSDSTVTLTVDITERSIHPLTIALEYQIAGGDWHPIGTFSPAELEGTTVGSQVTMDWMVGDYAELPNLTGHVMVRAVATNDASIRRTSEVVSLSYERSLPPEVTAIHVPPMDMHPDSGAHRGEIIVHAYTQATTNPTTSAIQFEIRRALDAPDAWQPLGIAQLLGDTTVVSSVQAAIIEDLVGAIVGGAAAAPISRFYRQWTMSVDTITLEDTILDDTIQDNNPYVIRAIAADVSAAVYPSAAGVVDHLSVDNYSPTEIVQVDNEIEMVAPRGDGSYYVSGLIAEDVPSPMLTLTARTGAHPSTFAGGIMLAVNDDTGTAMTIPATAFTASGDYTYTGMFDLGSLPNGMYTLMAVAYAADGSPEEQIVAMSSSVEVGNFTPPENFADPSLDIVSIIDTEGDARTPSEIDAMYPIGFPAILDMIAFTLTVPNVAASDIDVIIGGMESARMIGALTDDGIMVTANADGSHTFEIMLDTSVLAEGQVSLMGAVNKPNGTAPFGLPSIHPDRSGPIVHIVSPLPRHQVTTVPTIQITYADATGFDPNDMLMESMPMDMPMETESMPTEDMESMPAEDMESMPAEDTESMPMEDMESMPTEDTESMPMEDTESMPTEDMESMPTETDSMPMDMPMEMEFAPPVVITITRLATGDMIHINRDMIHITSAAGGEVLTQMGNIVYTHDDDLAGGAYRIEATVTDVLGNSTSAEPVEFTVEGVHPTVSIASPSVGQIVDPRQPLIVSAALTGNGEITVTEFQINGTDIEGAPEDGWLSYTMQPPLVDAEDSILQRGSDNTISIKIVDSEGRTAEGAVTFAVSLDSTPPAISGPSPQGDITRKIGRITARVSDNESDIIRIQYALDDEPLKDISFSPGKVVEVGGGKEVKGQTSFNLFDAPLGTHSVTIIAESTGGTSTLTWEFTIVNPDNTPPKVVTYSPLGIIRTDRPVLAATVSDESGFKRDGITLILAGVPGNQGSGRRSSPTSTTVTFTPSISVTPGPYTARITVIDKHNNRTEAEWQFTVELDETPPSITTTSPHGVIHIDKPLITASASDEMSGVDDIEITAKDGGGLPVNGVTTVRTDKTAATFTPSQALRDGTYTVDVKATDVSGNVAAARWQFTVELDLIPPSIILTRPAQEHTENRRPVISAAYTDNMSGVDAKSVKLTLDGTTVEPDELSETQVVFTPGYDLPFGPHTVTVEVSDLAPKVNTTVHEWTFYVERVGIADARNYPNPFDHETMIAFRISRQAKITVRVYDFTGRLVATPVANSVREAGLVEIDWHGETNAGDHLARGVYFCHILMESELEPQSTILKMAIVSD